MMKKRIFISSRCMEVGGIERSLLSLLGTFDYDRYEVDLFLWSHNGPFMEAIPPQVNLLPEVKQYALLDKPILKMFLRGYILLGLIRLVLKLCVGALVYLGKDIQDTLAWYYHEYSLRFLPTASHSEYSLAISFQGPSIFLDKIKAQRKIGWVHTDYSRLKIDVGFMERVWSRADLIATVSESCRDVFAVTFPRLADRLVVIENILSSEFVRQQANEDVSAEMPPEPNTFRLCTVGRYSHPKAFDRAVLICKKLIEMGCSVRWYAVGPALRQPELSRQIEEAGMEKYFVLLGEKPNPYPYMAACDIYVQPSRYEGKAVTVREAQILGKPVVITKYPTASSQLHDGYDGIIVPMEINACAVGLKAIIENIEVRHKLSLNALATDYSNKGELQKIIDMIPVD